MFLLRLMMKANSKQVFYTKEQMLLLYIHGKTMHVKKTNEKKEINGVFRVYDLGF